jgi:hypothetical protein
MCVNYSVFECNASDSVEKCISCVVDGITYDITVSMDSEGKKVITVENDKERSKSVMYYDQKNSTIESLSFNKHGHLDDSIACIVDENELVIGTRSRTVAKAAASISYGKVTKTPNDFGTQYWYCTGSSGTKQYTKIGCKATYLIRTDDLSSDNKAMVKEYRDAVRSCKSNYDKGDAALIGTGVASGVIVGMIICNVAFPPSVIVTIVLAAVGGGGAVVTAVNYLIDAHSDYTLAVDDYAMIKGLGTKL